MSGSIVDKAAYVKLMEMNKVLSLEQATRVSRSVGTSIPEFETLSDYLVDIYEKFEGIVVFLDKKFDENNNLVDKID